MIAASLACDGINDLQRGGPVAWPRRGQVLMTRLAAIEDADKRNT